MNFTELENIKKLAIIAMFSDDDLLDMLVLKGGNALDIIHKVALRASVDLDFSIEKEFRHDELALIESKIQKVLHDTYRAGGYEAFDISFVERPEKINPDTPDFWGGYQVEFKIIKSMKFNEISHDRKRLRRNAMVVGLRNSKTFKIDISKFEFCQTKQAYEIDGYTIYVYTPEMIVLEKLRAICQQMPEYSQITKKHLSSARARDFFDIYTVIEAFQMELSRADNKKLLHNIFAAKKVPLELIEKISEYREYHRPDFAAVKDTVKQKKSLKSFDFYFDYVLEKCRSLESLWIV